MGDLYYVEVVRFKDDEAIERMGPMVLGKAERVDRGVNINLNHDDYYTRIVKKEEETLKRKRGGI